MSGSVLVNGSQRSELVIFLSKGKRYGPIMATAPANKENVSPDKELDLLSDCFHKGLSMNLNDKDGRYFLDLMEKESERLTRLCQTTEQEMADNSLPEDASGKIRAASGKAKLLVNKKFKQFRGLCEMNLGIGDANGRRPTNGDLAGFWDMVLIQVDDVNNMFTKIDDLRKNGWKPIPSSEEDELSKNPPLNKQASLSRQPSVGKSPVRRQKSKEEVKAAEAEQRAAARQRLAAAKRTARQRMQQKANPLDNVEIFCSPKK